jgi:hypothetical protein
LLVNVDLFLLSTFLPASYAILCPAFLLFLPPDGQVHFVLSSYRLRQCSSRAVDFCLGTSYCFVQEVVLAQSEYIAAVDNVVPCTVKELRAEPEQTFDYGLAVLVEKPSSWGLVEVLDQTFDWGSVVRLGLPSCLRLLEQMWRCWNRQG